MNSFVCSKTVETIVKRKNAQLRPGIILLRSNLLSSFCYRDRSKIPKRKLPYDLNRAKIVKGYYK